MTTAGELSWTKIKAAVDNRDRAASNLRQFSGNARYQCTISADDSLVLPERQAEAEPSRRSFQSRPAPSMVTSSSRLTSYLKHLSRIADSPLVIMLIIRRQTAIMYVACCLGKITYP
jgi:hypothetical protein